MAITDKTAGVWGLDQTYNKINQGSIWTYNMFDTPIFVNWGNNDKGQLAHNNRVYYSSPTQVSGSDYDLTQACNFGDSTFVPLRKTDGTLWAVGQNDYGQLGQNTSGGPTNKSSPVQVGSDTTWAYCVAVPGQSIKSTKTDGTLWAWGASYWGELANDIAQATPTGWSRSSPVQIPGTDWDTGIRKHTGYGNSINAINRWNIMDMGI